MFVIMNFCSLKLLNEIAGLWTGLSQVGNCAEHFEEVVFVLGCFGNRLS